MAGVFDEAKIEESTNPDPGMGSGYCSLAAALWMSGITSFVELSLPVIDMGLLIEMRDSYLDSDFDSWRRFLLEEVDVVGLADCVAARRDEEE